MPAGDRNRARGWRRSSKPRASTSSTARPAASPRLAPILGKEIKYSYQVPLSEYVRRHADIMTMAVGLIIHGDQAEQILQDKQADLIAVGREILNNPNWPMDAALKLGVEGPFRNVPPQFGYWLGTRAKRGLEPSLDLAERPRRYQKGVVSLSVEFRSRQPST